MNGALLALLPNSPDRKKNLHCMVSRKGNTRIFESGKHGLKENC